MAKSRKPQKNPVAALPVHPILTPKVEWAAIWRRHGWRVLALWVITLAAYSNSFRAGLVFDNSTIIVQDTRLRAMTAQNVGLILNEEYWYNTMTTGLYRPLTTFSYLVNYTVFGNGPRPAGYHWVNFALHGLNILLVYMLGVVLFRETTLALWLAALWGLHPVLTESVTNVVGRADLLAAFGVLAALLCHIQSADVAGWPKLAWRCGLALAAAIGIYSKESAAVLPVLMLLYDLCWSRRAAWAERIPGYTAAAVPFAGYFYLRASLHARIPIGQIPFVDNPLIAAEFWSAKLTAIKVIGKYLWLWIWPARLSADYSYNAVPVSGWSDVQALIAGAVCLALAAIAWLSFRRLRTLLFFVAFFFIALAPTANLVLAIGTIMAERFLYLPSIGLAGLMVVAAHRLRPPRAAWAAVGLLCAAYAARTFTRNFDWLDERSLWSSAVAASPNSFKAHSLFASSLIYSKPPVIDRSVSEADRSLTILEGLPPELDTPRTYVTAATSYRVKGDSLGRPDSAYWYQKSLTTLLRGDQVDLAGREQIRLRNLEQGKRASSAPYPPLYVELGRTYIRLQAPEKAAEAFARGRAMRPDPELFQELARAWLVQGKWEEAAIALMEGIVIDPNAGALPGELAGIYRRQAPGTCALQGNNINVECPMVHDQLCTASRNVAKSHRENRRVSMADETVRVAIQSLRCNPQMFQPANAAAENTTTR